MLALDTNIVVRYLVGDHPEQSAKARALIEKSEVFVCRTVLLEAEWVLRSVYRSEPARIAKALTDFAGLPNVTIENPEMMATAIGWIGAGIDFADALHMLQSADCEAFMTYDADLVKAAKRVARLDVRTL